MLHTHAPPHIVESLRLNQSFDLRVTLWTVPDITDCSVVLRNSTRGVIDKCYNGPWMHILLRLDT